MSPEGVRSAITAVHSLHQVTIDRVTYDCSVSHALEELLGPTNIEDNPGAIPLNDRGFCLPLNAVPIVPRPPSAIYQEANPNGMDPYNQQRRPSGNNQMMTKMSPVPPPAYQIEPPMSYQAMNNNQQYMQYPKNSMNVGMQYNMNRPPIPPTPSMSPMFPPAPMIFPPANPMLDARLSNPGFMAPPPLPLPMQSQQMYPPQNLLNSSHDTYDSLVAATDRLTLSSSHDSNHHFRDSNASRESGKHTLLSTSTGSYQSSTVTMNHNHVAPSSTSSYSPQGVYTSNPSVNHSASNSTIFDAKNYYF